LRLNVARGKHAVCSFLILAGQVQSVAATMELDLKSSFVRAACAGNLQPMRRVQECLQDVAERCREMTLCAQFEDMTEDMDSTVMHRSAWISTTILASLRV